MEKENKYEDPQEKRERITSECKRLVTDAHRLVEETLKAREELDGLRKRSQELEDEIARLQEKQAHLDVSLKGAEQDVERDEVIQEIVRVSGRIAVCQEERLKLAEESLSQGAGIRSDLAVVESRMQTLGNLLTELNNMPE